MQSQALRQNRKLKITGIVIASLLLLYAFIGFVVLPWAIQKSLPKISEQFLQGREISIDNIAINPFALSLAVDGVHIKGLQQEQLLELQQVRIDFQSSSLFLSQWRFKQFELGDLTFYLTVNDDGSFNIDDIIQQFSGDDDTAQAKDEPAELPIIFVENLLLQNIALAFVDKGKKPNFESVFGPISVGLDNFSTLKEKNSPYQLVAEANDGIIGKRLAWEGTVTVNPLSSKGTLSIEGLDISRWATYFQQFLNVNVGQGLLDVSGSYQLQSDNDALTLSVENAGAALTALNIQTLVEHEPLLRVNRLALSNVGFEYPKNNLRIGAVELANSQVFVKLLANGQTQLANAMALNLPEDSTPVKPQPKSQPNTPAANDFQLSIDNIILRNNELQVEDNYIASKALWQLAEINAELKGFSLQENKQLPVKLSLTINNAARFQSQGLVQLFPVVDASLSTVLEGLELQSLQPYIDPYSYLQINQGQLAFDLQHKLTVTEPMVLQSQGNLAVSDFASSLEGSNKTLLSFTELMVQDVNFDQQKNSLAIAELLIKNLNQRVIKNEQGVMNIAQLSKPQAAANTEPVDASVEPMPAMAITLNKLQLENANMSFSDYAVEPTFLLEMNDLTGSIKGLSSDIGSRATIDLSGKLDRYAPVRFSGKLNFLSEDLYTDILLDINNLNMSSFNSYSQVYLGKKIAKGKLDLGVSYQIENNKLAADNRFFLDQFELGQKVPSKQATNLPVGLAMALLKNPKGEIKIDLPIHGDLNDPNFRYGKVVWKAIGNIIVKAASSPFSLLAGLVSSNVDLSRFAFAPGEAGLSEADLDKAGKIQQALIKRPKLRLEVQGCYSESLDGTALRKQALLQRLNPKQKDWDADKWLQALSKDYRRAFDKKPDFAEAEPLLDEAETTQAQVLLLTDALQAQEPLPDSGLLLLARQRQSAIYDALLDSDKIDAKRFFIKNIQILPEPTTDLACSLAVQ